MAWDYAELSKAAKEAGDGLGDHLRGIAEPGDRPSSAGPADPLLLPHEGPGTGAGGGVFALSSVLSDQSFVCGPVGG